ncbi:MAG TPA: hypothetical protein VLA89_18495, partial [Gemmatimonadales bacterium]|nr:hypothetical protein [Gemmatimonadales bacterium]
ITADAKLSLDPWYRAGTGLVFQRVDEDLNYNIWRADANGENAKQLTKGTAERIVDVSPDGSRVLFSRDATPDVLWSISVSGGEPVRLAVSSNPSARFSPDGALIAHTTIRDVQGQGEFMPEVFPAGGGTGTVLTGLPKRINDSAWSPDSRGVTFGTSLGDVSNLYLMPLDGSPRALTHFTEGRMTGHRWSPDGKRIAVKRRIGENGVDNLWIVNADGSNPVAITDFESGSIGQVRWSADGSRVVFTYGNTTQNVVLIRGFKPEKS